MFTAPSGCIKMAYIAELLFINGRAPKFHSGEIEEYRASVFERSYQSNQKQLHRQMVPKTK